jgi:hypothetical protein
MASYRIKFLESSNGYSSLFVIGLLAGAIIGLKARGVI